LLKNLAKLDLRDLRDRRFALQLPNLAQLPYLRALYLPPLLKIEVESLLACQGFNLRKLRLAGSLSLNTSQIALILASQPLLQSLDLGFCKALDQGIVQPIANLKELHSLHLDGVQGLTDLTPLTLLPLLSKLILHMSDVEDTAFNNFSTFTSLQTLDIQATKTTETVVSLLPISLTRLHLAEGCISDFSASHVKNLSMLRNLHLVKCPNLFGAGYALLEGCFPELQRLELRSQHLLTPEEWKFTSSFKSLRRISILDIKDVGDAVLENFVDFFDLRKLTVSPHLITHRGLSTISMLPITSLYLRNGSIIDDTALPVLFEFFTQLRELNLQNCPRISPLGQSALKAHANRAKINVTI
jgi:hypothetical protein